MATVTLTFKTPDAASDAVQDLPEKDRARAERVLEKWVEDGEYVYIDVDLSKRTAKVREAR
jgi:hypothetical protein